MVLEASDVQRRVAVCPIEYDEGVGDVATGAGAGEWVTAGGGEETAVGADVAGTADPGAAALGAPPPVAVV
jgi:hypothetical protein